MTEPCLRCGRGFRGTTHACVTATATDDTPSQPAHGEPLSETCPVCGCLDITARREDAQPTDSDWRKCRQCDAGWSQRARLAAQPAYGDPLTETAPPGTCPHGCALVKGGPRCEHGVRWLAAQPALCGSCGHPTAMHGDVRGDTGCRREGCRCGRLAHRPPCVDGDVCGAPAHCPPLAAQPAHGDNEAALRARIRAAEGVLDRAERRQRPMDPRAAVVYVSVVRAALSASAEPEGGEGRG